jgi:hypothetical protein
MKFQFDWLLSSCSFSKSLFIPWTSLANKDRDSNRDHDDILKEESSQTDEIPFGAMRLQATGKSLVCLLSVPFPSVLRHLAGNRSSSA